MPVSSTNTNIPQKPEKNNAPGTKTRGKEGMSMKFRFKNKAETLAKLRVKEQKVREMIESILVLREEFEVEEDDLNEMLQECDVDLEEFKKDFDVEITE